MVYMSNGNIFLSFIVSVVLVVLLYYLVELFISKKSEITKKRNSATVIALWTMYILLSIPISAFLIHFLNVEWNYKTEVQQIGNKNLFGLKDMINEYEIQADKNLSILGGNLNGLLITLNADRRNVLVRDELLNEPYNLNQAIVDNVSSTNQNQVVTDFIEAKKKLLSIEIDSLKTQCDLFLQEQGGAFDNWQRLKINEALHKSDTLLINNLATLKRAFKQKMDGSSEFKYKLPANKVNLDQPLKLFTRYKPYPLIGIALFFNLLLLLPFFLAPSGGTYNKYRVVSDSEGGIEIK